MLAWGLWIGRYPPFQVNFKGQQTPYPAGSRLVAQQKMKKWRKRFERVSATFVTFRDKSIRDAKISDVISINSRQIPTEVDEKITFHQ